MLEPGDILQERYEIQSLLGKGGYGAVYKAQHSHLQHTVAIKEMQHRGDPSFANRFEQEARMLFQLHHATLPKVSDYFLEGDGFYFVMEYIPGDDLGEYVQVQPDQYLDVDTTLRFITPVLSVLEYLHAQNPPVIHRDIKPANIRITPNGDVYLVDFGIARVYDPATRTSTAAQAVTPGFSPLEQYQRGATEPRTDLYALGATLYYMLSGVTPPDAIQRTQTDPLIPLSELNPMVPDYLEAIVHRLLAVYPDQRYQDVQGVQHALALQSSEPGKDSSVSNFEQINKLRVALQEDIAQRQTNKQPNILEHASLKALQANLARLERIEELLRIEQYRLVFIGQVGTGKTTAICHLLNLVYEDMVTKKSKGKSRSTKQVQVTHELLSTGAGKTTICEVVIQPAPTTAVEIMPYSADELTTQIEEFCRYIWARVYPASLPDDTAQKAEHELERAIRNVTGLPQTRAGAAKDSENSDGSDESPDEPDASQEKVSASQSGKLVDKAQELAEQFQPDQFDEFRAEVVARATINERTETRTVYTAETGQTETLWLQENFANINLAKNSAFSIPRRISLFVSPALLDLEDDLRSRFAAVIDTRGLDGDRDRPDLKAHIRDSDDALCIFTDLFPPAPNSVIAIMKRYLTAEAPDIASRSMLMVLPKRSEPENVVGADGSVGDRDHGIAIREGQIEAALTNERINIATDNIIFYDALQFYIKDGKHHRRDSDYDAEDIEAERETIFEAINQAITARNQQLWDEVRALEKRFREIQQGHSLSPADEQLIRDVKSNLRAYRPLLGLLTVKDINFIERYINFWLPKHAMLLRATNRRHGIYESGGIDIYFTAGATAEILLREKTEDAKEKIRQEITRIKQEAAASVDLTPLIDTFLEQVDRDYQAFLLDLGQAIKVRAETGVFAPQSNQSEFWQQVDNRFGKGPGYKKDVITMYQDRLTDKQVPEYLQEQTRMGWEAFVDGILSFFG